METSSKRLNPAKMILLRLAPSHQSPVLPPGIAAARRQKVERKKRHRQRRMVTYLHQQRMSSNGLPTCPKRNVGNTFELACESRCAFKYQSRERGKASPRKNSLGVKLSLFQRNATKINFSDLSKPVCCAFKRIQTKQFCRIRFFSFPSKSSNPDLVYKIGPPPQKKNWRL